MGKATSDKTGVPSGEVRFGFGCLYFIEVFSMVLIGVSVGGLEREGMIPPAPDAGGFSRGAKEY